MTRNSELQDFLKSLPKAEHHIHIEGSCPWDIMARTDPQQFDTPPPSWAGDYRFETFDDFEQLIFKYVVPWMISPERYAQTVETLFKVRREENLRYIEFSFAGIALEFTGLAPREIAQAIRAAVPQDMEARLYIGLHHSGFSKDQDRYLSEILDTPEIDGIDLHGPEEFPLRDWSKEFWKAAKSAGKALKAHAGELSGPSSVREVIEDLGVTKVQHGIRAIEDPGVMDLAVQAGASFDVCPISNVKLRNVSDISEHPLMKLEAAGIPCTLNTDDPFIFGNTLTDDYMAVAEGLHASPKQLAQFARNGFTTADLPQSSKLETIAKIDSLLDGYLAATSQASPNSPRVI
ncbi:MAG: adenosine deaminase [Verrucomicrobiota bacterium]|nr:adenosine deaminase [Verrucomicrobiota bacterium]